MAIQLPMDRLKARKHTQIALGRRKSNSRNPMEKAIYAAFMVVFMCFSATSAQQVTRQEKSDAREGGVWHVKALHPDGYILDVRAYDRMGNVYEVKAVNDSCQSYIMDINAYSDKEILPVKVLMGTDGHNPVSAIDDEGKNFQLRAVTPEGKFFPIRGSKSSVYTVDIKAVTPEGRLLNIRAVSPDGKLREVKGIKMYEKSLEMTLQGVEIHAHLVALPQLQ